jgi:hypothetical protein
MGAVAYMVRFDPSRDKGNDLHGPTQPEPRRGQLWSQDPKLGGPNKF